MIPQLFPLMGARQLKVVTWYSSRYGVHNLPHPLSKHMLKLLQSILWKREMRRLQRELGDSPTAQKIEETIARGYNQFLIDNREVIAEEDELRKQRQDIQRMKKELRRR